MPTSQRLLAIDALRGLVMLFMLLDHVRETFFLQVQVSDPMTPLTTDPALFFTRVSSMVCAPVFVFLTGLSAWLYGQQHSRADTARFLLKRGLFLIVLELTLVNFAWNGTFWPHTLWLQVIWAIGLSMIALAGLLWLPRQVLLGVAVLIVAGHNLLDGIRFAADSLWHAAWAIVHQRDWLQLSDGLRARTTYPVLPWIGVIALGYCAGPWFGQGTCARQRLRVLWGWGVALVLGFALLRYVNVYGDTPWVTLDTPLRTAMSVLSLTKYPPSLLFLLPTLGVGLLLLAGLQHLGEQRAVKVLSLYGGAPMFFYLLHLLLLKALYLLALAAFGANYGTLYGFDHLWAVWLCALILAVALYGPTRAFAQLKQRRRDLRWLRYL